MWTSSIRWDQQLFHKLNLEIALLKDVKCTLRDTDSYWHCLFGSWRLLGSCEESMQAYFHYVSCFVECMNPSTCTELMIGDKPFTNIKHHLLNRFSFNTSAQTSSLTESSFPGQCRMSDSERSQKSRELNQLVPQVSFLSV